MEAAILGIAEGLTEFLPVSGTGHLIIAGDLLGLNDQRAKVFQIAIQLAAILAVVWEYRAKIGEVLVGLPSQPQAQCFALAIIAAFLRAAVLGFMFAGSIKADLFNPLTVVTAFIKGGLLILWAERRNHRVRVSGVDDMTWTDALKVGFAQAVAMTPGGLALQRLHGLCLVPDSLWDPGPDHSLSGMGELVGAWLIGVGRDRRSEGAVMVRWLSGSGSGQVRGCLGDRVGRLSAA